MNHVRKQSKPLWWLVLLAMGCVLEGNLTAWGQSRLDGTSFQISTYNLGGSIGEVRLTEGKDSNCRSAASSPIGDDLPLATCLTINSGGTPVTMTFGGAPQTIGKLAVSAKVTPFAGFDPENPIFAENIALALELPMATWSTPGDLIEFTMRTTDNTFPSDKPDDFWGFAARGIQYPQTDPAAEVGFFHDDVLDTHNNFYVWFEDKNGPIKSGYDLLVGGLGSGRHPTDPTRRVAYIFYSEGEVDGNTDTLAGGKFDFFSHGSDLSNDPAVGNLRSLAGAMSLDPSTITGWGFGVLVQPPAKGTTSLDGDFNLDGRLTDADIDLLSAGVGGGELKFDLNQDGGVTNGDRIVWVEQLAKSFFGDIDLNGGVDFSDFLVLSSAFGEAGGWAKGDFDGSKDVQFADFLLLSSNFGKMRLAGGVAPSVPEPSVGYWIPILGIVGALHRYRRK